MSEQEQPGREVAAQAPAAGAGAMRVSHEDRDAVAEALRVAAGDGRLSSDELDERLEKALTAVTYADFTPLLSDLPGTALGPLTGALAAAMPGAVAAPQPKELITISAHASASKRDGAWVVPARMKLAVHAGAVVLDFRRAVISAPTLHIDADVHAGSVVLLTRPGIAVDFDDVSNHSGVVHENAPWGDSTPVFFRISVSGRCHAGTITAGPPKPPRPPRRTFWQWLTRAPRPKAITESPV